MVQLTFTNGDVIVTPEEFIAEWTWEYRGNGHALVKAEPLA